MRKDLLNLRSRLLAEMGDASNILMFIGNQKLKKQVLLYLFKMLVFSLFYHPLETFYIKSLTGEVIKALDLSTFKTVLEEPRTCRWKDSGKYFRWAGEMLVNDEGNFLTLCKCVFLLTTLS